MLGFLYSDSGNKSPAGQPFEGLTGSESNPDSSGKAVPVFKIKATDSNAYFMPGADPGEGYSATNSQLFDATQAPVPPLETNSGFVTDYAYTLGWQSKEQGLVDPPGTLAKKDIMGMFTPRYRCCPDWRGGLRRFATNGLGSVPTETLPNRAFASAGTSQGHMDDKTKTYTAPSIFGLLTTKKLDWRIYGYSAEPLTRLNFPDTTNAPETHFGLFTDFQVAAAAGTLPPYTFVEPSWESTGNSQHPNYDVALGEQPHARCSTAGLRKGPAGSDPVGINTRTSSHGGCALITWHLPRMPCHPMTTRASSDSTSSVSACACRPCWCRR